VLLLSRLISGDEGRGATDVVEADRFRQKDWMLMDVLDFDVLKMDMEGRRESVAPAGLDKYGVLKRDFHACAVSANATASDLV